MTAHMTDTLILTLTVFQASVIPMHLTKTTAALNEGTLSYYRVRGLYFLAVVFVATKATPNHTRVSILHLTSI